MSQQKIGWLEILNSILFAYESDRFTRKLRNGQKHFLRKAFQRQEVSQN